MLQFTHTWVEYYTWTSYKKYGIWETEWTSLGDNAGNIFTKTEPGKGGKKKERKLEKVCEVCVNINKLNG